MVKYVRLQLISLRITSHFTLELFLQSPAHGNEIAFLLKLCLDENKLESKFIDHLPYDIPLSSNSYLLINTIKKLNDTAFMKGIKKGK
jgi:hypothetical protein